MMATTHGYAGLAVAAGVTMQWPEFWVAAAVGGIIGGLFPDLDILWVHRQTLHFPVYYSVTAASAVIIAAAVPSSVTVGAAVALVAAAVHSISDAFGGSADPAPWETTTTRAVYAHPLRRWIHARRWIQYDGSPGDLLLCCLLAVPGLVVFRESVVIVTLGVTGLVVSALYTALRKPIGEYFARSELD